VATTQQLATHSRTPESATKSADVPSGCRVDPGLPVINQPDQGTAEIVSRLHPDRSQRTLSETDGVRIASLDQARASRGGVPGGDTSCLSRRERRRTVTGLIESTLRPERLRRSRQVQAKRQAVNQHLACQQLEPFAAIAEQRRLIQHVPLISEPPPTRALPER
jgi:hypothetical protein